MQVGHQGCDLEGCILALGSSFLTLLLGWHNHAMDLKLS